MNVPNHERKAFRDMTPEERSGIVEAILAGNAEAYGAAKWQVSGPWVAFDGIYRTRPRQLVIPWEHIKPEYKWAAMDNDGAILFSTKEPKVGVEVWLVSGESDVGIRSININTTGIDWRESLTARPEGV